MTKDPADPYANYGEADLLAYLRGSSLERPPGESSHYSNLGVGLLGYLLARRAGVSYEELVRDRITGPLGMADTAIALTDDQRARLVGGSTRGGEPVANWDLNVLSAAGALRSTADDMLTFVEANLIPDTTPLGPAIRRAQETHFGEGQRQRNGLGWVVEEDIISKDRTVWHNGGTGGYKSFLGLAPEKRVGIVLLSNTGDAFAGIAGDSSLDELGFSLLRTATKVSLPPIP